MVKKALTNSAQTHVVDGNLSRISKGYARKMVTSHFTQWIEQTDVAAKITAIDRMCHAYLNGEYSIDNKRAAESAMMMLLDDPSPDVRQALSARICVSEEVPLFILNRLAQDQIDIAGPVLAFSPYLTENCLIDLIANGTREHRMVIAQRADIGPGLAAALIEVSERDVIFELLRNKEADIVPSSLDKIVERYGFEGRVRSILLERRDLTTTMRLKLVEDLCDEFSKNVFVSRLVGVRRAKYITKKSRVNARLSIVRDCFEKDIEPLAEYLLQSKQITQGFLMSVLCVGNVEFFASAIGKLTRTKAQRVGSTLASGSNNMLQALYKRAGISAELAPIFADATIQWRNMDGEDRRKTANQIMANLIETYSPQISGNQAVAELMMSIENIRANQYQYRGDEYIASLIDQAA